MNEIDNKLFDYFCSDSVGLLFTVNEIAHTTDHPLHECLKKEMLSLDVTCLCEILSDTHFLFLNSGLDKKSLDYEARIEFIKRKYDDEILRKRCLILRMQDKTKRPLPYNHKALLDLTIDEDFLVPISSFQNRFGPLKRNDFAFGIVPPVPSVNSAYWFSEILKRPELSGTAKVRLDPFLVREEKDYSNMEYRAWWYGVPLNWERINNLKQDEHRRAGLDEKTRKDIAYTDLVWSPRGDEIHFICEELPSESCIDLRGSRYFHAIYIPKLNVFRHIDGALRIYSYDEWKIREEGHVRNIGKIGKRIKIFRLDGEFRREIFCDLIPAFFVWNDDVCRYIRE